MRHFSFINFDDPVYVTLNRHVTGGLTRDNLTWAFTTTEGANWFPLTWISLMADCQFFGAGAGPQHVTNVLLHAVAALLLFGLLKRLSGATFPSAAVAFLFALHPLRVESVVWVTERKDVLSALFWMLTLWTYVSFAQTRKLSSYLWTVLFFCLGFMAKPIVVTLPVVLILLDFWPIGRISGRATRSLFTRQTLRSLLWDKLPFFALSVAMSAVTIYAQKSGDAVRSLDTWPLVKRLGNAVVSGTWYIAKTLWPSRLAIYYPSHPAPETWQIVVSAATLLAITILVLLAYQARPYLAMGWFWYLITVLPVIGIVQVGEQARADRYTYIPGIGLSIMLAWSVADAWRRWPRTRPVWIGLCSAAGLACLLMTGKQISYWENSRTLFQQALLVTEDNEIAHGCLGDAYRAEGRYDEAMAEYRTAIAIKPNYLAAMINLGSVLGMVGRIDEALVALTEAIRLKHNDADARNAMGLALALRGNLTSALEQFEIAALLKPDSVMAHTQLGKTYGNLRRFDDAIAEFSQALRLEPDSAEARSGLERALAAKNGSRN